MPTKTTRPKPKKAELRKMTTSALLDRNAELTRERQGVLEEQRVIAAELDARAAAAEERRRAELAELGQTSKPPTQSAL